MVQGATLHGRPTWADGTHLFRQGHGFRQHRTASSGSTPSVSASASATTLDAEVSSAGALFVTTNDGDKISISFAALNQLHASSLQGGTKDAGVADGNTSAANGISVSVSVDGSLNSGEVTDIANPLKQLAQAIQNPANTPTPAQFADGGSLDSLSSFQFAYLQNSKLDFSSTLPAS